jgi:hypothetical protein
VASGSKPKSPLNIKSKHCWHGLKLASTLTAIVKAGLSAQPANNSKTNDLTPPQIDALYQVNVPKSIAKLKGQRPYEVERVNQSRNVYIYITVNGLRT